MNQQDLNLLQNQLNAAILLVKWFRENKEEILTNDNFGYVPRNFGDERGDSSTNWGPRTVEVAKAFLPESDGSFTEDLYQKLVLVVK